MNNKNITIDDVLEFIRRDGWKYSKEIREELDKQRIFSDEMIDKEIETNFDFYKRLADM